MSFNEQLWDEARDNPDGRSIGDEGLWALRHAQPRPEGPRDVCVCGSTRHEHTDAFRSRARRVGACDSFVEQRGSVLEREREGRERIDAERRRAERAQRAARGVA